MRIGLDIYQVVDEDQQHGHRGFETHVNWGRWPLLISHAAAGSKANHSLMVRGTALAPGLAFRRLGIKWTVLPVAGLLMGGYMLGRRSW